MSSKYKNFQNQEISKLKQSILDDGIRLEDYNNSICYKERYEKTEKESNEDFDEELALELDDENDEGKNDYSNSYNSYNYSYKYNKSKNLNENQQGKLEEKHKDNINSNNTKNKNSFNFSEEKVIKHNFEINNETINEVKIKDNITSFSSQIINNIDFTEKKEIKQIHFELKNETINETVYENNTEIKNSEFVNICEEETETKVFEYATLTYYKRLSKITANALIKKWIKIIIDLDKVEQLKVLRNLNIKNINGYEIDVNKLVFDEIVLQMKYHNLFKNELQNNLNSNNKININYPLMMNGYINIELFPYLSVDITEKAKLIEELEKTIEELYLNSLKFTSLVN